MVAHRLAVPRTAVAEFNIYVEMWGRVFYSGVAALISFVYIHLIHYLFLYFFSRLLGGKPLHFCFSISSGVAELMHCQNHQLWL